MASPVDSASQIGSLGRGTHTGSKPPFKPSGYTTQVKELIDLQLAESPIGASAGCLIYQNADVSDIRKGDMLQILTDLHKGVVPILHVNK